MFVNQQLHPKLIEAASSLWPLHGSMGDKAQEGLDMYVVAMATMIKSSLVGQSETSNPNWRWAFSSRGFRSKLDDGRSLRRAHSLRNKSRGSEAVFLTFPPWSWCFREQRTHLPELNLAFIFSMCSSSLQHSMTVNVLYFESISPLTWLSSENCKEVRSLTFLCSGKRSRHKLTGVVSGRDVGCY